VRVVAMAPPGCVWGSSVTHLTTDHKVVGRPIGGARKGVVQ